MIEWYFEYEIYKNWFGLFGDVFLLIGMFGINIVIINGVDNVWRGLFFMCDN